MNSDVTSMSRMRRRVSRPVLGGGGTRKGISLPDEKAVGGLQSSNRSDGGETARTIAHLLNWMQEQQEVFVIGTANDVRQLAPEQLRQGRFSQVVFVDLPTPEDRAAIFRVHLAKRGRDPEGFG